MKRAFSILMLLAVLSSTLTRVWVVIDFKINQNFIAESFCINKERLMVMCNGKCYLSEQLKKAEQEEKKQAPQTRREKLQSFYILNVTDFRFKPAILQAQEALSNNYYICFLSLTLVDDIFHPPQVLS